MDKTVAEGFPSIKLTTIGNYPTATIRIALQSGDKEKVNLMLSGDISRVDPASAERLTTAIVQKGAECLLDISTDLRRQGLFILPFRVYTMTMTPEGTLSYPSAQAVALPTDHPPHPEITAASATDDALTLAIRFPVKPHRLTVSTMTDIPEDHSLRTFISYPLYIPDPKEMRGSIGTVRAATGGIATGIRFSFLSTSAIKASVAAPEKYYELAGNERTGYRMSTKGAATPDYSCYAETYGYVPPFPRESLTATGSDVDTDTDPMDWIADWRKMGEGYLPMSLPSKYHSADSGNNDEEWPDGMDRNEITEIAEKLDMPYLLLIRLLTPAAGSQSPRNVEAHAIRTIRVHGMPDAPASAILYGSDDCRHWTAMRRFDPRLKNHILTPPRFWWCLLLFGKQPLRPASLTLEIN